MVCVGQRGGSAAAGYIERARAAVLRPALCGTESLVECWCGSLLQTEQVSSLQVYRSLCLPAAVPELPAGAAGAPDRTEGIKWCSAGRA